MASSSTTTTIANAHNKPSSAVAVAVAAAANQQQQDLHPLKCPRCDSSNTKFCYYNNYSLSQPRHFCKACKRYWTRGGTLRNVPVGGGCRKNKRPKRHSSAGSGGGDSLSSVSNPSSQPHNQIDLPLSSNNHLHHQNNNNNNNPLFYGGGLSSNPLELNFPFSSFRVSNSADNSAFDLNALGLGFSSGLADSNGYKNGFKPIQDASSAASPFSSSTNNNNSIFFGSSAFSTTASTMASLLASTQKFGAPGLMHYEDPQMAGMGKQQQVKAEGENRLAGWNPNPHQSQSQSQSQNLSLNPMDQMNNDLSDPSPLVWNTSGLSGWFDPSSMGSSVPSLI